MSASKVNEAAPMIVRVVQGSLMAGHGAQKPREAPNFPSSTSPSRRHS